jgi:Zn-finger nucleic acid-binding protein
MKCPIDNVDLQMTERQSVEIDYCPKCRGVWLDRGELDKIIEKMEIQTGKKLPNDNSDFQAQQPYYSKHGEGHGSYNKHGRKSFLRELFD